ncbi:EF-hand domain-containing protein D2-like [Mytilus californianus]|uniref:EF-hand domain-containing protein D2 homolog,EF-hand domain-containing protein D1,EF-hand domain-containing protein D2 n=1 Tax=Mytilus coruscus TaxID=42192 RepID=A0A6J8BQG0_MYTCO|nr:EF-hand domain-containing protein D2-like [Mytilus californianus]CAC5385044.1 EF-hand domain-containing protein D2 homolog,EF-hand domain-containing protein D1,EF-hand domain-containing protein D2 [Mytilus coruscus]
MATDELAKKLERRVNINEGDEETVIKSSQVFNPYTEFKEFSRKQIQDFQKIFNKYDTGKDKFIDFHELKLMMEKLEAPQTHLSLKAMIKEIDEDNDGKINFREFLLIFRKANLGELDADSGLMALFDNMTEIDVDAEGVKGAKSFFEAKIDVQTRDKKFENEIKQEQEEKKKQAEEAKERKKAFKEKASVFN